MTIVCDTNVLVSGLLWSGPPNTILKQVRDGQVVLVITPQLLEELMEVLNRSKFGRRKTHLQVTSEELVNRIAGMSIIVTDVEYLPPVILEDPDDDRILECAVRARAEVIVSGDQHLLNLKAYHGILIRSPAQFLEEQ
jgi:putative PIN family toxin of toxin-antitoxin system